MPTTDQLTIRSLDPRLRAALEREATRRGQSLDETALALLAERLGLAESPTRIEHDVLNDLDELAGTWSASDAADFDRALRAQRQVDATLWR